jgi:hypothetical protein
MQPDDQPTAQRGKDIPDPFLDEKKDSQDSKQEIFHRDLDIFRTTDAGHRQGYPSRINPALP